MKKRCRSPKKKAENKDDAANVVTKEIQDALLLVVDSLVDSQVLDFGASFHTTAHCDIMENYVAGNYGKVYLLDGEPLEIVGMGDIRLKLLNEFVQKIWKVRYVPMLMCNLISVGQLDDERHNVAFTCDAWKVTKGSWLLLNEVKMELSM